MIVAEAIKEQEEAPAKTGMLSQPITGAELIKVISIVVSLIGGLISVIWFAASLKGSVSEIKQQMTDYQGQQSIIRDNDEKQQAKTADIVETHSKDISQINNKLDVTITILNRIDRKVGGN